MAKLSLLPPGELATLARRMADAGIAVTVLPTTDLFPDGARSGSQRAARRCERQRADRTWRELLAVVQQHTDPATPYGDCSLIRMANLYANVVQLDRPAQLQECFNMLTERSARVLNLKDYGFAPGNRPMLSSSTLRHPNRPSLKYRDRLRHSRMAGRPCDGMHPTVTAIHIRSSLLFSVKRKVKNLPHPALRATLSRRARLFPSPPGEGLGVRERS